MQVFRDTLGTEPTVWAAEQVNIGSGDQPKPSPTSLPAAFTEPIAHPQPRVGLRPRLTALGKGRGSGRHRAPAKNLHSTTIPAQMARPVELCMKSMVNTTGLGPGAGVDAPCRFPVTLSAQKSRVWAQQQLKPRAPATRSKPHPPLSPAAVYRAHRQPRLWPAAGRRRQSTPLTGRREPGLLGPQGAGPAQVRRPVGRPTARPRPGRTRVKLRPPQVPRSWPRARRSRPQQEPDRDPRSGRQDARARLRGAPCQASPRPARDPPA